MIEKAISAFGTLVGRISLLGGYLAAAAVAVMAVLICVEVIGRGLFGVSTMIADEMSGYLNCAIVFLGLSYSLRERGFIRVEVLYGRLVGNWKRLTGWAICVISLVYAVIVTLYMARHVAFSYQRGIVSTQVSETPLYIPQSLILAGSVILVLQLFYYVLDRVRNLP